MRLALLHALFLGTAACAAPAPVPGPPPFELPERWAALEPAAFEAWLFTALPPGSTVALPEEVLGALDASLDRMDASSVRAAAILARSGDPAAHAVALARLERRATGDSRAADAGDVVAASALSRGPLARAPRRADTRARLEALAVGDAPHPDLEVRVHCAAAALELGSRAPVPFLLRVLRIGTPSGAEDPEPWADVPRSAWVRDHAARALSALAGVPCTYVADGSIPDREREAARLGERLGAPAPNATSLETR